MYLCESDASENWTRYVTFIVGNPYAKQTAIYMCICSWQWTYLFCENIQYRYLIIVYLMATFSNILLFLPPPPLMTGWGRCHLLQFWHFGMRKYIYYLIVGWENVVNRWKLSKRLEKWNWILTKILMVCRPNGFVSLGHLHRDRKYLNIYTKNNSRSYWYKELNISVNVFIYIQLI